MTTDRERVRRPGSGSETDSPPRSLCQFQVGRRSRGPVRSDQKGKAVAAVKGHARQFSIAPGISRATSVGGIRLEQWLR